MAENVSTLSIDVGINAEKAMSGLGKLGDKVDSLGKTVANFGKAAAAGAFAWLAKEGIQAAAAFAKFADDADKLGKSLGSMYGNLSRGGEIMSGLSEISGKTGTNVETLAASMEKLAGAGFGLGKSLEIIEGAGELDWLFGGNGKGVAEIAGGVAALNGQMVASADLFDKLRSKGVNAYDDLAKAMGVTADEAERLLQAGSVTGFQASQAIAASLKGSDAKAKRAEADTTLGRLGQLASPMQFAKKVGDKVWNEELDGLRSFVSNFFAPFGDKAQTVNAGKVSLGGVANEQAEQMRQLTAYMRMVGQTLTKTLKTPFDKMVDDLANLDGQIRAGRAGGGRFNQVVAQAEKRKTQLIEEFAKLPLNAYEQMGKEVLEVREQIAQANKSGQKLLAFELEKKLAGLAPRYETAFGPIEKLAEKLQFAKADAQKAVDKFGDQKDRISEKFNNEAKEFIKALRPGPDGPLATLTEGLADLDKAAKRISDMTENEKLFDAATIKQGLDLLKQRQERLLQDFESGTLTPYEKFVKDSAKIAKDLAEAAKAADPEVARRLTEVLNRQKETLDRAQADRYDSVLTDAEKFTKDRIRLTADLAKAQAGGDKAGQLIAERQLGEMARRLADSFKIGDSFWAGQAEKGSQEAYAAEMRAKFGDGTLTLQERMAAAQEKQVRLAEQTLEEQKAARAILAGQGPPPAEFLIP
jgi:hypothetical protein